MLYYFKCNLCTIARKKANGNMNLLSHIESSYLRVIKEFLQEGQGSCVGLHIFPVADVHMAFVARAPLTEAMSPQMNSMASMVRLNDLRQSKKIRFREGRELRMPTDARKSHQNCSSTLRKWLCSVLHITAPAIKNVAGSTSFKT